MRKWGIASLLLAMTVCQGWAQELKAYRQTVEGSYNYWYYTPNDEKVNQPLIVFLHGASLCGNNLDRVRRYGPLDALNRGRKINAHILAPQNPGGSWKPEKILKLVEWAEQNYKIDSNRIYIMGLSLGGFGCIDTASTFPDRFAAAMALCGGGTVKDYEPLNKIPLWILHGTADRDVSIKQSDAIVAAMKKNGEANRLIYSRLSGQNHGALARVFYLKDAYDWLLSHSLEDESRPVNRAYSITVKDLGRAYADLTRPGHLNVAANSTPVAAEKKQQSIQEPVEPGNTPPEYTVKKGDNLYTIAKRYHTTSQRLMQVNQLKSDKLQIGQRLKLK